MDVTPEQQFRKEVWEIIQEIKLESLATANGKPVVYSFGHVAGVGVIPRSRVENIIRKLEDWGALRIQAGPPLSRYSFDLVIREPTFSEVYEKFREGEGVKGPNSPSRTSGRGLYIERETTSESEDIVKEKYYAEEIEIINKLLQVVNKNTRFVEFVIPAEQAKNDPNRVGVDNINVLNNYHTRYGILSNLAPPIDMRVLGWEGNIRAELDYSKLLNRAENLHDDVESSKGEVFGIELQKKKILKSLQKYIGSKSQNEYAYSERILGTYTPTHRRYPSGVSIFKPDQNRPDIRYTFMRAMRGLEKDGYIEITGVEFDFNAEPEASDKSAYHHKWSLSESDLVYYPAKHCKVTFRMNQNTSSPISPLPEDVKWSPEDDKCVLLFNDGKRLAFKDPSISTSRYFRLLIDNHGNEVKHINAMKHLGEDNKEKIENIVKGLRKKITNAQLSKRISINTTYKGGYTLIIK